MTTENCSSLDVFPISSGEKKSRKESKHFTEWVQRTRQLDREKKQPLAAKKFNFNSTQGDVLTWWPWGLKTRLSPERILILDFTDGFSVWPRVKVTRKVAFELCWFPSQSESWGVRHFGWVYLSLFLDGFMYELISKLRPTVTIETLRVWMVHTVRFKYTLCWRMAATNRFKAYIPLSRIVRRQLNSARWRECRGY